MISNNYSNIQNNQNKRQQQSFGNALAPVVAAATFIESNGFLGEFLTIDAMGMGVPRTVQGYNRNKEELGHLNYKAGREEMVRELLSGPAFFVIPATILGVASMIKGKSTKVTTETLDVFKKVMGETAKKVSNAKDGNEIKEKFIHELFDTAFEHYENKGTHVDKIKQVMTKYVIDDKKSGVLGFFDSIKENAQKESVDALTSLNKANGKFLDNTGAMEVHGQELEISQMVTDLPNYLKNFTKSAAESSEDLTQLTEKFHEKTKKVRQWTNIAAGAAVAGFLLVIPKLYQTGKEFPGVDGLDTQNAKKKVTKGKQTVNFSGKGFDKVAKFCDIDKDNSFTRNMFFTLSGIFMLGARFKDARGNDEKREVLTRDIPAVAIAVYGAKLLNNGIAKLATSLSGIPIGKKIADNSFIGKITNGFNFASQKQVDSWYTNFGELKNPLVTFAETIHRNEGKLSKVMEKLGLRDHIKGIAGKENATNDEIISALKKAQELKDEKFTNLEKELIKVGQSKENKLLQSAKNLQAVVKLGNLGLIAAVLGFFLPRLNIVLTKKKYQQKPVTAPQQVQEAQTKQQQKIKLA